MELFKLFGTIAITNADANEAIDDTTDKAEESEGKISSAFKKIGTAVTTYFAVDKIKDFGMNCINAAADASATSSQFTQVFGDMEGKASKSLKGIADGAGISENRMKGSFTKIAAFAKTTGMDTESALSLSERAMIAVADSAAFYDRSLEDTTESLQSFLKGNYENDAALGLSCTETTRNAAANKLYGKSFNELSESQKQLTLLQMVEDANAVSGALGQAARESDTWTNVTGNLQQSWTDFQSVIGSNILPFAVNAVKRMISAIENWIEKIPELVNWCKEHESTIQMIGIALGTVAVAIGAYNLSLHASAIAAGIATAATSAFGAVMSFVTSPVTLVVLAIGALVAAGVLLWKNWDVVKEKAGELWGNITEKFEGIKETVLGTVGKIGDWINNMVLKIPEIASDALETAKNAAHSAKETIVGWIDKAKGTIPKVASEALETAKSAAQEAKEKIVDWIGKAKGTIPTVVKDALETAKNAAKTAKEKIVDWISKAKGTIPAVGKTALETAKSAAQTAKEKIVDWISKAKGTIPKVGTGALETAKSVVSGAVEKIKGFFNFSWSLPKPKLPHFSVSGGEAPWGFMGEGSLPSIGISWYKKAMDNAMILKSPSIFGYSPASGNFLGAGEAGSEVVSGTSTLMNMIHAVVSTQNNGIITVLYKILDAILALDENMGGNMREALAETSFKINRREFARLVKAVDYA
ncbi:MAG: hypothetical protein MR992_14805 [Lachnospiraceae bacterium]|nr:hypothetical protein [Lachnospiraceae bacterium]